MTSLDSSNIVTSNTVNASDVLQPYTLLTGGMVDQAVTLAGPKTIFTGVGCRVYNSATVTIPTATPTPQPFDSESFDTDTMHDLAISTTRITIRTAGIYVVLGTVRWDANATGSRTAGIYLNNTSYIAQAVLPAAAVVQAFQIGTIWNFSVSDYIEFVLTQDSGADRTSVFVSGVSPLFSAMKIG